MVFIMAEVCEVCIHKNTDHEALAEALKQEANACFEMKQFECAIGLYTKAIQLNPKKSVYFANRSFAYLKTECFGSALEDASRAIELNKKYVKAYYRRATAYMALGRFRLALRDFETVHRACPNDEQAREKYKECSKLVKKLAFEKAISVSNYKTSSININDYENIVVENSYKGPILEDGKVTRNFIIELMETYKAQGKLHKKFAYKILLDIRDYLMKQPTLVDICIGKEEKFTICGDIHGQFYDLMNIFYLNGLPSPANPYLFNGDFVDRGSFSVECIFTLFSFKLLYPDKFFMSRGNHESQIMNQMYGFEGEVKQKYNSQMAAFFTEVYNYLPLAHCLNKRVLVMHGGLFAQEGVTLNDINDVERNRQPPEEGLMCDILWSDPQEAEGRCPSKRGVGIQFGPDVTEEFICTNKLDYIIRSHEVKPEGYEVLHNGKCITIFSAPNYCDTVGNKGAFITLNGDDMKPHFTTFTAVPHPDVKPMAYASSLLSLIA